MNRLAIVIVNWNAGRQLQDCLDSIDCAADALRLGELGAVVIVDNASTDQSADNLSLRAAPLTVLHNTANRGFASACNQGAAATDSELILFLNPDTRLFADSLVVPVQWMRDPAHQTTGIVGIACEDASGTVVTSCARYPRASHFLSHALGIDRIWPSTGHYLRDRDVSRSGVVDQVIGAYFLIRRNAFDGVGGFDKRFFMYFEEVDLSLRVKRAGWDSMYLAHPRLFHRGGGSSDQVRDRRLFYSVRSRIQYGWKHFGAMEFGLLLAVSLLLEPATRILVCSARRRWSDIGETLSGYSLLATDWLRQLRTAPNGHH